MLVQKLLEESALQPLLQLNF